MSGLSELISSNSEVYLPQDIVPSQETICQGRERKPLKRSDRLSVSMVTVFSAFSPNPQPMGRSIHWVIISGSLSIATGAKTVYLRRGDHLFMTEISGSEWILEPNDDKCEILEVEVLSETSASDHDTQTARRPFYTLAPEQDVYQPAGHKDTFNRRLFCDKNVEILLGEMKKGGGADAHVHDVQEQFSFIVNPALQRLIYTPAGVLHGVSGQIPEDLDLVVIYAPPLNPPSNPEARA